MSSALYKYITHVDQGSSYDIGSRARVKLVSGSTNLSNNSSVTCVSMSTLNLTVPFLASSRVLSYRVCVTASTREDHKILLLI